MEDYAFHLIICGSSLLFRLEFFLEPIKCASAKVVRQFIHCVFIHKLFSLQNLTRKAQVGVCGEEGDSLETSENDLDDVCSSFRIYSGEASKRCRGNHCNCSILRSPRNNIRMN